MERGRRRGAGWGWQRACCSGRGSGVLGRSTQLYEEALKYFDGAAEAEGGVDARGAITEGAAKACCVLSARTRRGWTGRRGARGA